MDFVCYFRGTFTITRKVHFCFISAVDYVILSKALVYFYNRICRFRTNFWLWAESSSVYAMS
jgi:hypothetical protein